MILKIELILVLPSVPINLADVSVIFEVIQEELLEVVGIDRLVLEVVVVLLQEWFEHSCKK